VSVVAKRDCCPPSKDDNRQASIGDVLRGVFNIKTSFKFGPFFDNGPMAMQAIGQAVHSGVPVPITITFGNLAAHYICAIGTGMVGGKPALWVFDPWPHYAPDNNLRLLTLDELERFDDSNDDTPPGRWTEARIPVSS
jgi:hypothetical protein